MVVELLLRIIRVSNADYETKSVCIVVQRSASQKYENFMLSCLNYTHNSSDLLQ